MKTRSRFKLLAAAIITVLWISDAPATEGGGSNYPMGAENFLAGALPPPGFYTLIYVTQYEADELMDGSGDSLPIDFDLCASVIAPRLVWVTDKSILGGQLFYTALMPLVDLEISVNGLSDSNTGVGDLTLTGAVAYHHSPKFHSALGLDLIAPVGEYDAGELANIGRNYWAFEAVYAVSWIDPAGVNADIKLMYDYNFENSDTDYKSGQEFHFDYALGYALNPNWVLGVSGYGYKQTTPDKLNGAEIGNEGQAFAIGPSIKYQNRQGFFFLMKYQKEYAVENRPKGGAFWIKTILPF